MKNLYLSNKLTKAISIIDDVWEELDPEQDKKQLEELEEILFNLGRLRDEMGE